MADQPQEPLADAARSIGNVAGKIVSTVTGGTGAPPPAAPAKANTWNAEYAGSGTFVFHKPKRQARKRRQQAVKNRRRGMR